MIRAVGALVILASPLSAQSLAVPSGQQVTLQEAFFETQQGEVPWLRLRFLAPEIARDGGAIGFVGAEADIVFLCQTVGLEFLETSGQQAALIIVSLSDRVLDFGATDPDATQFFEAYRPEGSACIWEGF